MPHQPHRQQRRCAVAHASAHVSRRQHTVVSVRQHTLWLFKSMRPHRSLCRHSYACLLELAYLL
jgi:hypothetical protein